MKKIVLLCCGLTLLHHAVQGLAWSFSQGQGAAAPGWLGASWRLLSFPLFWVVPDSLSHSMLRMIGWLNSVIRGLTSSLCIALLASWRPPRARS